MKAISIVTPCFNDEQSIRDAYECEISQEHAEPPASISFATMLRRIERLPFCAIMPPAIPASPSTPSFSARSEKHTMA